MKNFIIVFIILMLITYIQRGINIEQILNKYPQCEFADDIVICEAIYSNKIKETQDE